MPIVMPRLHLKTTVQLGEFTAEVSTVELPVTLCGGYETCIFFSREGRAFTSEVVAIYGSRSEARSGHEGFSNPAVLRNVLGSIREREFLVNEIRSKE